MNGGDKTRIRFFQRRRYHNQQRTPAQAKLGRGTLKSRDAIC